MDKFPEAFKRFEQTVDTKNIVSFGQLVLVFRSWAGSKWKSSIRQVEALKREALKRGIPVPREPKPVRKPPVWREGMVPRIVPVNAKFEVLTIRGRIQPILRSLATGRFIPLKDVVWKVQSHA